MAEAFVTNGREKTAVYIRPGGPGNRWKLANVGGAEVDAITGGATDVESKFGTNSRGQSVYLGSRKTGNPGRRTTTLRYRPEVAKFLAQQTIKNCPFDVMVQLRCGDITATSYDVAQALYDASTTNVSTSNMLANLAEGTDDDQMIALDLSGAPLFEDFAKLVMLDVSGTVSDFAINQIISVGAQACAGGCSTLDNPGDLEYFAVTDRDNTPGYLSQATPRFLYSTVGSDGVSINWSGVYINSALNADATSVAKLGDYVFVAANGVHYALIEDIRNGVTNPFRSVTGLTSPNFPTAIVAVGDVLWGVGAGGRIYKSNPDGFAWSIYSDAAVTSAALTSLALLDSTLGYFAGASGTLVQLNGSSLRLVPIRTSPTAAALTTTITGVAVADQRGDEVLVTLSNGTMFLSKNARASVPTFTAVDGPDFGVGSLTAPQFVGYRGNHLFVLQTTPTGNTTRLLRDISGGAGQWELVSQYVSPSNFGINSVAMANINSGMVVGEVHESFAFLGRVTSR